MALLKLYINSMHSVEPRDPNTFLDRLQKSGCCQTLMQISLASALENYQYSNVNFHALFNLVDCVPLPR